MKARLDLDPDIEARVKKLADAHNRSSDWVLRQAIEQYVDREERRAQFREDAAAAWHEHEATGQHLTAAEVDAWLSRLEAGEVVEPPVCHG